MRKGRKGRDWVIKGCYCPATLWGLGDYVMFSAGGAEGRLFKVLRPQLRLIAGDSRGVLKGGDISLSGNARCKGRQGLVFELLDEADPSVHILTISDKRLPVSRQVEGITLLARLITAATFCHCLTTVATDPGCC